MRYLLVGLFCLCSTLVGVKIGKAKRAAGDTRSPAINASNAPAAPMGTVGSDGYFSVTLEPAAARQPIGPAGPQFTARLGTRSALPTRAAIAFEITDDRGRAAQPPVRPGVVTYSQATPGALAFRASGALPDGFYTVRVTDAMSDGQQSEVLETERYVGAQNGVVTVLTPEDWFTQSAANIGTRL